MIRPRISILTDRGHGTVRRRSGPAPRPRGVDGSRTAEQPPQTQPLPANSDSAPALRADLLAPDSDFCRAREAGGPEDTAQYSCCCGYQFAADVSTSVACPHCGTDQAW